MADALICAATAALLLAWIIYPLVMLAASYVPRAIDSTRRSAELSASVVIASRDEPAAVARRIRNLEMYRGELQQLQIVVSVDCRATDKANAYRDVLGERAIVVEGDEPGGKASTLNAGLRSAKHPVVIFTDSAQEFCAGTLKSLVLAVQAPRIGAATGHLRAESNRPSVLLRAFWIYESWLRRTESRVDSIVGVTGAIYAIRRHLWEPLPASLINDDLFVPLSVIGQGYRVVTCDAAIALDGRVFGPVDEFQRKVRTLTGILQLCKLRPALLIPFCNRVWFQFLCHKLLRFGTPYWILLGVIGVAARFPLRVVVFSALTGAATLLAAAVAPRPSLIARSLRQFGWTVLVLGAPLVATLNALRGDWNVWRDSKPRQE